MSHGMKSALLALLLLVGIFTVVPAEAQLCLNNVPNMTSSTSPSGTVTRSGVYSSSYEGWKAFDSSNSSMWISKVWQTPAWLAYDFGTPRYVNRYAITYSNGSITTRAPKHWTLQAWNGITWVTVDTRTNQTGWSGSQTRYFQVAVPGSYSRYRLHITDDNDSRSGIVVISIGRLRLENCMGTVFCGSGVLCSSQSQCNAYCGGNPLTLTGTCQSGCCYCL